MLVTCPKCGLSDQMRSVESIITADVLSRGQTAGFVTRAGETSQFLAQHTYVDESLAGLQDRVNAWVDQPKTAHFDATKYKKSRGFVFLGVGFALAIANGSLASPLMTSGLQGVTYFGNGVTVIAIALGAFTLLTRKSRIKNAGAKSMNESDKAEYLARLGGWYCLRCGMPIANRR